MIEVAKEGAKEVEAIIIIFGVEEGEKFALALLILYQLIKVLTNYLVKRKKPPIRSR
jgi:hypothetical protein